MSSKTMIFPKDFAYNHQTTRLGWEESELPVVWLKQSINPNDGSSPEILIKSYV